MKLVCGYHHAPALSVLSLPTQNPIIHVLSPSVKHCASYSTNVIYPYQFQHAYVQYMNQDSSVSTVTRKWGP